MFYLFNDKYGGIMIVRKEREKFIELFCDSAMNFILLQLDFSSSIFRRLLIHEY